RQLKKCFQQRSGLEIPDVNTRNINRYVSFNLQLCIQIYVRCKDRDSVATLHQPFRNGGYRPNRTPDTITGLVSMCYVKYVHVLVKAIFTYGTCQKCWLEA